MKASSGKRITIYGRAALRARGLFDGSAGWVGEWTWWWVPALAAA